MALCEGKIVVIGEARIPMIVWPVIAVCVILIITLGVAGCNPQVKSSLANTDLAAFHLIGPKDLSETRTGKRKSASEKPSSAEIVGHVTLTAITKGGHVTSGDVTDVAVPNGYAKLVPVAFHIESDVTGTIESGSEVQLLFAPVAEARARPLAISAVLLSETKGKESSSYVVAVSPTDRVRLLDVVARSHMIVVPATATPDPATPDPPSRCHHPALRLSRWDLLWDLSRRRPGHRLT